MDQQEVNKLISDNLVSNIEGLSKDAESKNSFGAGFIVVHMSDDMECIGCDVSLPEAFSSDDLQQDMINVMNMIVGFVRNKDSNLDV